DLEQRNGRIIRQGNVLFEDDPENFSVEIDYYATKQTYDARMWQTIEYKAAAIEQFRKGDLLQRVIDDVQSEAATAAEMKAAASGNPLILYQVQIASELRKLEALASQHQRTQHRLKDRLKYLQGGAQRYAEAKTIHDANVRLRDANTRHVMEKGEKRIQLVLEVDGRHLDGESNKKEIQQRFLMQIQGLKATNLGEELPVGKYRGFDITVMQRNSTTPQFQFSLKGAVGSAMYPENLRYVYGDTFSLNGFFQRVDNILDKGLQQRIESAKQHLEEENKEIITVETNLAKPFGQQQALELARENHAGVMAELKRMQDDKGYESTWSPRTLEVMTPTPKPDMPPGGCGMAYSSPTMMM
ncbi:MAG: helicase, partial [Desulfovibrio sp.]|nr:helicase [Desulfovibrio sp.]